MPLLKVHTDLQYIDLLYPPHSIHLYRYHCTWNKGLRHISVWNRRHMFV